MPHGKPAGVRCANLTAANACAIFGQPDRPAVCANLKPDAEMCGNSAAEAVAYLTFLEQATTPRQSLPLIRRRTAGK
jgi:uncharacterized protein